MEIRLALPNKGRLYEPTLELLSKAGFILLERDERALYARTSDPELSIIFVRAADIPKFVESEAADLGITGFDYITESRAKIREILDLDFGKAKIVLAAHERTGIRTLADVTSNTRIATKLSVVTEEFLSKNGKKAAIVKISGAAEIMPFIGVADMIVDTMSTGTTLKTHGLAIVAEVLQSSARLIANETSFAAKESKIMELVLAFESVIRATKKKLIMMNVPEANLEAVVKTIPSMGGPTLAKVESETPMWEVYSVIEEKQIYKVINMAKKAGARDILVLPIERIIP